MKVTVVLERRDASRLLDVMTKFATHDSSGISLAGETHWVEILDAFHEALECQPYVTNDVTVECGTHGGPYPCKEEA